MTHDIQNTRHKKSLNKALFLLPRKRHENPTEKWLIAIDYRKVVKQSNVSLRTGQKGQLHMEETKNTTEQTTQETQETKAEINNKVNPEQPDKHTEQKNEPNVNDLMVEIAKLKRMVDKNASEAKEWKEKFRSTQSEKEILDAEKAEAQAKRDEEFETMKRTIQIHDLTENFMDLGYPKDLAKKAAASQVDNDTQSLLNIQKQFQEQQKKDWEKDFIASRPDINIGSGSGNEKKYTKEEFDKMTMIERTKLKRENEAEYQRLLAL